MQFPGLNFVLALRRLFRREHFRRRLLGHRGTGRYGMRLDAQVPAVAGGSGRFAVGTGSRAVRPSRDLAGAIKAPSERPDVCRPARWPVAVDVFCQRLGGLV